MHEEINNEIIKECVEKLTSEKALIKQLRHITGYGIIDCKKAVRDSGNDLHEALVRVEEIMKSPTRSIYKK